MTGDADDGRTGEEALRDFLATAQTEDHPTLTVEDVARRFGVEVETVERVSDDVYRRWAWEYEARSSAFAKQHVYGWRAPYRTAEGAHIPRTEGECAFALAQILGELRRAYPDSVAGEPLISRLSLHPTVVGHLLVDMEKAGYVRIVRPGFVAATEALMRQGQNG